MIKGLVQFLIESSENEKKDIIKELGIDDLGELFKVTKDDIESYDKDDDEDDDDNLIDITGDDDEDDDEEVKEGKEARKKFRDDNNKVRKAQLKGMGTALALGAVGLAFPPLGVVTAPLATGVLCGTIGGTAAKGVEDFVKYKKLDKFEDDGESKFVKAGALLDTAMKNEKDAEKREKLQKQKALLNYCMYDKDGKKRGVEEQYDMLKNTLGKKGMKSISNAMDDDAIEAALNSKSMKKLDKKIKKIKPEEWKEYDEKLGKAMEKKAKELNDKENDKEKDVKKDKDGNILKKETVTDPKTGEKKKVVTHTGPRGGKFYYPEGKPKNDEHKVYVQK